MAGLLDQFDLNTPQGLAYSQMAAGLLGPGSNAQRFAGAASAYAQQMQAEQDRQLKRKALEAEIENRRAQVEEAKALAKQRLALEEETRRKATEQLRIQSLLANAVRGVKPSDANAVSGVTGPRPEALNVVGQRAPIDYQALIAAGAAPDLVKALAESQNYGRPKVARTIKGMVNGREQEQQFDDYGQPVGAGMEQYRAPITADTGGALNFLDPYNLTSLKIFGKTQSPDSMASNAVTMRGQNMADARARDANDATRASAGKVEWKQDVNGNWVGLPREVTGQGPVVPVMADVPGKKASQSRNALDIIAEAEGLIGKATGSYFGAGVDQAARVFGASTEGANATAELKALEGALMMAQPRMEGPQSNIDVQLYRQMAAQIGDPTVPAPQKQAALARIKKLHERYGGATGGATGDWEDLGGGFKVKR